MLKWVNGHFEKIADEEIKQIIMTQQKEKLETMKQDLLSKEEAINIILSNYTVITPSGEEKKLVETINQPIDLPIKIGYKWERKLIGNNIFYEAILDPDAIGTEQNPIIYTAESPLINNAFYKKEDGHIYVYISEEWILWE